MRVGSLFSGIGAPEIAWSGLGWRFAWQAEIDAFPSAVLRARFPGVPNLGDVTKVDWNAVEPVDVLVAGSPCQSFSIAGKRLGLDDPRGNLALVTLAIARRLRPRWLVFENVPGLLSSDSGRDFGAFLGRVGECGYPGAWRVLDAQFAGVPQRRRRVFFIGYLGDWRRAAAVLLEPESLSGNPAPRHEARQAVAGSLGAGSKRSGGRVGRREAAAGHMVAWGIDSDCIDRSGEGAGETAGERSGLGITEEMSSALRAKRPNAVAYGGNNQSGPIDVATAVNAHGGPHGRQDFESETFVAHIAPPVTSNQYGDHVSREGLLVTHSLRADGFDAGEDGTGRGTPLVPVASTITRGAESAGKGGYAGRRREDDNNLVRQQAGVRRLTPRECERLQGMPDDWTLITYRGKPAADGPRYKAIGNSMAVPVVRWIGERIALVDAIGNDL